MPYRAFAGECAWALKRASGLGWATVGFGADHGLRNPAGVGLLHRAVRDELWELCTAACTTTGPR